MTIAQILLNTLLGIADILLLVVLFREIRNLNKLR